MSNNCPIPDNASSSFITMAHGGGGKLTSELIDGIFRPAFCNDFIDEQLDGAIVPSKKGNIAFTTDTFVVSPLFFKGGNIGDLAVNGTVNDVLCCGAIPQYLSCGFVIEEGFGIDELSKIVNSMAQAAKAANVKIVTGDTKVVEHGKCDGIYINTSGIGQVRSGVDFNPHSIRPGDKVIVTGSIGNHGIAILAEREGLKFASSVSSDTVALTDIANNLLVGIPDVRIMRDPTRGGLSSTLNEIATLAGVCVEIDSEAIPVSDEVNAACEMLGLDPLYIANEGVFVIFVAPDDLQGTLGVIRASYHGKGAKVIGEVTGYCQKGEVVLRMPFSQHRIIEVFSGEQLPRIC